jgi:alpha-tubulin suppressor-like RCC1 family protein
MLHTCAVLADGSASCWGYNLDGQLGNGGYTDSLYPVAVEDLVGAVAIAAGDSHSCALLNDGTVRCWGLGGYGQIGDGEGEYANPVPVAVTGLADVVAISAGGEHSCALRGSGDVWCWGKNEDGELGTGNRAASNSPVQVVGLSDAVAISAGVRHTCAVLEDGGMRCWGYNGEGQVGNGETPWSTVPTPVTGSPFTEQIFANGFD